MKGSKLLSILKKILLQKFGFSESKEAICMWEYSQWSKNKTTDWLEQKDDYFPFINLYFFKSIKYYCLEKFLYSGLPPSRMNSSQEMSSVYGGAVFWGEPETQKYLVEYNSFLEYSHTWFKICIDVCLYSTGVCMLLYVCTYIHAKMYSYTELHRYLTHTWK